MLKNVRTKEVVDLMNDDMNIQYNVPLFAYYDSEHNVVRVFFSLQHIEHFTIDSDFKVQRISVTFQPPQEIRQTRNKFLSRLGPELRIVDPKLVSNDKNHKPSYAYHTIRIPYQELPWGWYRTVGQHTTGWTARHNDCTVICNYYYFSLEVCLPNDRNTSKIRIKFPDESKMLDMCQIRLYNQICLLLRFLNDVYSFYTLFVTPYKIGKVNDFVFIDDKNNQLYLSDGTSVSEIEPLDTELYEFIK